MIFNEFLPILTIYFGFLVCADYPDPILLTGDLEVHDPTLIKLQNGNYVIYCTRNGLAARNSADRVNWSLNAIPALPEGAPWCSNWPCINSTELWAPDISYQNGKYFLYYAAASTAGYIFQLFGWQKYAAIGLATSLTGEPGSFTDQGIVLTSNDFTTYYAIDPNLFVDPVTGRWWLTFGSYWFGIHQVELNPSTGKVLQGAQIKIIASRTGSLNDGLPTAIEAPFLFKHGSFYYLFVSFGVCCKGVNSTYRIMVGRSSSPNGPFFDRNSISMRFGGGTEILSRHGNVIGPGGQIIYTDAGQDLLVYHYYDGANKGAHRLGINYLGWDTHGWPYIYN